MSMIWRSTIAIYAGILCGIAIAKPLSELEQFAKILWNKIQHIHGDRKHAKVTETVPVLHLKNMKKHFLFSEKVPETETRYLKRDAVTVSEANKSVEEMPTPVHYQSFANNVTAAQVSSEISVKSSLQNTLSIPTIASGTTAKSVTSVETETLENTSGKPEVYTSDKNDITTIEAMPISAEIEIIDDDKILSSESSVVESGDEDPISNENQNDIDFENFSNDLSINPDDSEILTGELKKRNIDDPDGSDEDDIQLRGENDDDDDDDGGGGDDDISSITPSALDNQSIKRNSLALRSYSPFESDDEDEARMAVRRDNKDIYHNLRQKNDRNINTKNTWSKNSVSTNAIDEGTTPTEATETLVATEATDDGIVSSKSFSDVGAIETTSQMSSELPPSEDTWQHQYNSNKKSNYVVTSTSKPTEISLNTAINSEEFNQMDDWDEDKFYNLLQIILPELFGKLMELSPELLDDTNKDVTTNILVKILPELIESIVTDKPDYFRKKKPN